MSPPRILIVGVGSPYGDDQAGWLVARQLAPLDIRELADVRLARTPADLLHWLAGVERLVICDACRGLGRVGAVHRWDWPLADERLQMLNWAGTHDLALPAALALAQRLGCLPAATVVWGIEGAPADPSAPLTTVSAELGAAVSQVAERIWSELTHCKPPDVACTNSP